jgi:predicted PurR-regulated permease PerM
VTLKTVLTVSSGVLMVVAIVYGVAHALLSVTLIGTAVMIAVALDHAVVMLQNRGVNRSLAIAIISISLLGLVVALGFTLIPPAIDQGRQLIHDAPSFIRQARGSALFRRLDMRYHIAARVTLAEQQLPEMLEGAATPILSALGGLLSALGAAVTVAVLVVFMLIFGGRLIKAVLAEARPEHVATYQDVLHKIYQSIGGYLGGLALVCSINATLTTSFLAIDRVPFFLPLGIISGMSSMVPYAGPAVIGSAISVIALLTMGLWHGIAAGIYFIAYGQIEGNLLSPLIFRRTVHVNPLITTLSILVMAEIAGVVGAIVAVPVVATLQIVLREVLRIRRAQLKIPPTAID